MEKVVVSSKVFDGVVSVGRKIEASRVSVGANGDIVLGVDLLTYIRPIDDDLVEIGLTDGFATIPIASVNDDGYKTDLLKLSEGVLKGSIDGKHFGGYKLEVKRLRYDKGTLIFEFELKPTYYPGMSAHVELKDKRYKPKRSMEAW